MTFKTLRYLAIGSIISAGMLISCAKTQEAKKQETTQAAVTESSMEETQAKAQAQSTVAKTEDVEKALEDSNSLVIDARINDAYNGWAVDGVSKGGHLPNATDYSSIWIDCEYDEKNNLEGRTREEVLDLAMKDKGITPDKNLILYDTNGKDAQKLAEYFQKKGLTKIQTYDAIDWINQDKELVSYENYKLLVPPAVVKDIVEGKEAPTFEDAKSIKIFDISWGDVKESGYLDGHVPGAIHINTDSFEPPKEDAEGNMSWMLADTDVLKKLLLDNGISSEDTVICTGPEPMAACRFAVICRYMGVKDARVMNGGLVLWKALGYELEQDEIKPSPISDFGVEVPANPSYIDSMDAVKEILEDEQKSQDFVLVDNRTWEEHIGKVTGYSYHNKKGRIPGSVFGHAGLNNSSSMSFYRNIDKTMRNEKEIQELWKEDGIDTTKHLSFMCGSGWRAAEVLWDARVMGLENTSLYSDGWIHWSNSHYPTESGEPTK